MFKKKHVKTEFQQAREKIEVPTKTVEQVEAEKIIARSDRIKALSDEAAMWRSFATGCQSGRQVWERSYSMYGDDPPSLKVWMDADAALLWKDFAIRMAEDRERRLRDMLGMG